MQDYIYTKNKVFHVDTLDIIIKTVLLLAVLIITGAVICQNFVFSESLSILGASVLILISVLQVIKVRKNLRLLIVFFCIAYSNYSIAYFIYFTNSNGNLFWSYAQTSASMIGLICLLVFNYLLYLFLPAKIEETKKENKFIKDDNFNIIISIGVILVLIFILIFAFGRPQIQGERGEPTALYEYSILFFLIGFYYCGNNRWVRYLLICILLLFILQNFVFGGRITGLQLILLLLMTNFEFIKKRYLIILGGGLSIILVGIGIMRADFQLSLASLKTILLELFSTGGVLDTAYSAYHTSLTFVLYKDMINNQTWELFLNFLLSMLLGGSQVPNSNLAEITHQYYTHYYGGVLPLFGWFYLGFLGVVLIACLVAFYVRKSFLKCTTGLRQCISIYLACSVFRWYLYSPSNLIRGVMLLSIMFLICNIFHKFSRGKR